MRGKTTSVTSLWAESCGEGKGQEEKGKKERNRGKEKESQTGTDSELIQEPGIVFCIDFPNSNTSAN